MFAPEQGDPCAGLIAANFRVAGTVGCNGSPVRELALRLGLDPHPDDPVRVLDAAVVRTGDQASSECAGRSLP
jgi:hypothetical protein